MENQVLIILTGIFFLLAYLESTGNFDFGEFLIYFGVIWLLSFIGIMVSNLILTEKKIGEFKGKLELERNAIKMNGLCYNLHQIKKITIHATDYEGQRKYRTLNFVRHVSNGLNNEMILKLLDGSEVKCHFFQSKGQRIKNFKDLLTYYHLEGKISWLHLIDILEITDYNEIQKFKEELKKK